MAKIFADPKLDHLLMPRIVATLITASSKQITVIIAKIRMELRLIQKLAQINVLTIVPKLKTVNLILRLRDNDQAKKMNPMVPLLDNYVVDAKMATPPNLTPMAPELKLLMLILNFMIMLPVPLNPAQLKKTNYARRKSITNV